MQEEFICDTCNQSIGEIDDGWVEWLSHPDGNIQDHALRLVHIKSASPQEVGCQHDEAAHFANDGSIVGDLPLSAFVGPDGLMTLLEWLLDDKFAHGELLEMIRRIHVPGYELARFHFESAIYAGAFEPNCKEGFYSQDQIRATIDWADSQK